MQRQASPYRSSPHVLRVRHQASDAARQRRSHEWAFADCLLGQAPSPATCASTGTARAAATVVVPRATNRRAIVISPRRAALDHTTCPRPTARSHTAPSAPSSARPTGAGRAAGCGDAPPHARLADRSVSRVISSERCRAQLVAERAASSSAMRSARSGRPSARAPVPRAAASAVQSRRAPRRPHRRPRRPGGLPRASRWLHAPGTPFGPLRTASSRTH
jgi:hypothetical protein